MKYICTLVVVQDVLHSRKLYEKILKQRIISDFGEFNVTFEGGLALYKKDLYQKILGDRKIIHQSNNFELYFEENDLSSIEKQIRENDFELIHGIREEPWKQLAFRFYDYDKNVVIVAENMDHTIRRLHGNGLSHEEIAAAAGMPIEEIRKALTKS